MATWKQELQQEIAGIEDVNRNAAVLTLRIDSGDDFFGGQSRIIEIIRALYIKAPRPVNTRLVDGMKYLAGDFVCQVAFLRMKTAHDSLPGDPVITINREEKTLDEVRPFTSAGNWGVCIGCDTFTIGGDVWNIAGVLALQWLSNEPALLEFTLRK